MHVRRGVALLYRWRAVNACCWYPCVCVRACVLCVRACMHWLGPLDTVLMHRSDPLGVSSSPIAIRIREKSRTYNSVAKCPYLSVFLRKFEVFSAVRKHSGRIRKVDEKQRRIHFSSISSFNRFASWSRTIFDQVVWNTDQQKKTKNLNAANFHLGVYHREVRHKKGSGFAFLSAWA